MPDSAFDAPEHHALSPLMVPVEGLDSGRPRLVVKPLYVSIDDTVKVLGLSRVTVHRLLTTGAIESRYHGRRRLVNFASLEAWADNLPAQQGA